MTRVWWPRRVGSRFAARAGAGDVLVESPAFPADVAAGVRRVRRVDLAGTDELARLSAAGIALVRAWCGGPAGRCGDVDGVPLAEAVAGELFVGYLDALRTSFLLARLVGSAPSGARVTAAEGWTAMRDGLEAFESPPAVEFAVDPGWPAVLRAGPGFWARLRRWRRAPRGAAAPTGAAPAAGAEALVGLPNYRNRVLLDAIEQTGERVARLEPHDENRYLPRGLADESGADEAARLWPKIASCEPPSLPAFPEAPGWDPWRLLRSRLAAAGPAVARRVGREARGWSAWLRESRPRAIVGGIPWSGDLRILALAAAASPMPYLAVQDGALASVGLGGLLPRVDALAWGAEGRAWFVAQGCPPERVALVGDLYLDRWVERVQSIEPREARRRLGLPADGRLALGVLQNSAPHIVVEDEDAPLEEVLGVARGVRNAGGWLLCVKPHPRLPRVDGWGRVAEAWRLARDHGARLVSPFDDVALAMAAADLYVSHGDTLTLEALACGRRAVVWDTGEPPCYYPDFPVSDLPLAGSPEELSALLTAEAPRSAGQELMARHLARDEEPAAAVARLAKL